MEFTMDRYIYTLHQGWKYFFKSSDSTKLCLRDLSIQKEHGIVNVPRNLHEIDLVIMYHRTVLDLLLRTRAKLASRKMSWCYSCTLLTMQKQVAKSYWWHLPTALCTTALSTIYCTTLTWRTSIQHEAKLESAVLASRPVQSAVNPTTYLVVCFCNACINYFRCYYFMG